MKRGKKDHDRMQQLERLVRRNFQETKPPPAPSTFITEMLEPLSDREACAILVMLTTAFVSEVIAQNVASGGQLTPEQLQHANETTAAALVSRVELGDEARTVAADILERLLDLPLRDSFALMKRSSLILQDRFHDETIQ